MMRMPPWCLVVMGVAACTACTSAVTIPPTPHLGADVAVLARERLSTLNRAAPEAPPCSTGWAEASAGYVVAVAEWAERAGLSPGDQIVAVNGAPVAAPEERLRAYGRVPAGRPFSLRVLRKGEPVTLTIPCRYRPEVFRAERRTLEAAGRSDWDGCISAAREARELAGVTAYANVIWEHACTRAKNPSMASPEGRDFASLSYETARLLLRDSRYVPGGPAKVRETIRKIADDLRRSGAAAQADDLESQLHAAIAPLPRLQLTWADNSSGEDGFLVERKVGQAGTYVPLATLGPNTVAYEDTSVQIGVTYCYRVKAFTASSYSSPSNEACATPSPPDSSTAGE